MDIFSFSRMIEYFPKLIKCLPVTLYIVIMAMVFGTILGVIIALLRIYKIPVLNQLSAFYISFIRGTPINIQLFIVYFGVPMLLSGIYPQINRAEPMLFVIITYALNNAAFFAELIRAAVTGVDFGQNEAGYSIGMTKLQTFFRITVPQAFRIAIPDIGNTMINLLKNTALAYTLGIIDLMGEVVVIGSTTRHTLEGYINVAIIYIILSVLLERCFLMIERKLNVRA
ncbi:MAG: amino acid ABC transporter permease [Clostridiales bacterium]|nr:amino acid ABC transporter permease [Clostridiales bacterium]